MKKKFIISWEEFLPAANERLVYDLDALCRGFTVVYAHSGNEARRLWKRAFPRSTIKTCVDYEKEPVMTIKTCVDYEKEPVMLPMKRTTP